MHENLWTRNSRPRLSPARAEPRLPALHENLSLLVQDTFLTGGITHDPSRIEGALSSGQ